MKTTTLRGKLIGALATLIALTALPAAAAPEEAADSLSGTQTSDTAGARLIHRIGAEFRPEHIFATNDFMRGCNAAHRLLRLSTSAHLRYSFQYRSGSRPDRIYGGAYQGIGIARYAFGNRQELGVPVAVYLFQGARIARISSRLSFNYEWNFGLSFGWNPYSKIGNKYNVVIGSKMNAYLNADFYFDWHLSRRLDLQAGLSLTHFSNGNTEIPNAGLNSAGLKAGLTYNFGRTGADIPLRTAFPVFPRHVSYDLVLFGAWRRTGVTVGNSPIASPDAYTVVGFNFTPMYNFAYKFRAGLSLDGVYDGSANVYVKENPGGGTDVPRYSFLKPSIDRQLTLGVSARAEFVMPYFTINFGLGVNVLHKGGDLKSFYQILALKIGLTHSSFLHIGYCLKDFHTPNFLMLGAGYRFNNKYPRIKP